MIRFVPYLALLIPSCGLPSRAQTAQELITSVQTVQAHLQHISYSVTRIDTLVDGTIRRMKGHALMQADTNDRVFGYRFQGKKEGMAGKLIFDGHIAYETNDEAKTYTLITNSGQIKTLLNRSGGHIIVPDLIRLDTSRAVRYNLTRDNHNFYLTMHYPNLTEYEVVKRYKTVCINQITLLPVSIRQHQETMGKVQDLYWELSAVKPNDPAFVDSFPEPAVLASYRQLYVPVETGNLLMALLNKPAPSFLLPSLTNSQVSSASFGGKVTLLDFWEVWCGPCLESMPKVERLLADYSSRGLQVLGIIHETKQIDVAKRILKKRGATFTVLLGNAQSKHDYHVSAIPLYVLINQQGTICFISQGFSPELEAAIQKIL